MIKLVVVPVVVIILDAEFVDKKNISIGVEQLDDKNTSHIDKYSSTGNNSVT